MTWAQDVSGGWRLARPGLDEVYTPRRRALLLGGASAIGVVGSAVAHVLLRLGGESDPGAVAMAFALGWAAAAILPMVFGYRWRPPKGDSAAKTGPPPFRRGGVLLGDGAEKRITEAWRAGREPEVSIPERLAAARRAESLQAAMPRILLPQIAWLAFPLSYVAAIIALLPNFVPLVLMLSAVNAFVQFFGLLAMLGRTSAAIETAPDVPEHLEADGRKKRVPVKTLGTDHPDDYR
ncbi:hypothetical protein [Frondihabitans australicus]|uniref:Uncharacterized protein n=1 Tax=Frondihabitans australicus TaxID=386892 RepID=A0A495IFX4_9MICO|nr:hypothetical protein [Frondihabitans australicus]RKR74550.1 hypothetical protein C8E83_1669 [Frondihabitans australicus]